MDLGTSFDQLLVAAATWLLVLSGAWLAAVVAAVAVEAVTDGQLRPARWTGAPPALRRVLLTALLAGLAAAGVAPVHADQRGGAPRATLAVEGLPLPTRPAGALTTSGHVVRPGESLWSIARGLAPGGDDTRLAALVHTLHATNRAVIGDDPDVLQPGQRLVLPDPPHPTEESR